jgi:hypothetical protein
MLRTDIVTTTQEGVTVQIEVREQSIKKPSFFLLIYCFTYNLTKLVSFKVLPSTLDTPHPKFFPVLERVLERVLRDGVKVPYRIFFYLLYRLGALAGSLFQKFGFFMDCVRILR